MILADSDVLIDYLIGISPVREQIARLIASGQLETTTVNVFEILSGAEDGKLGDPARALIAMVPCLPLDLTSAERAAGVRRQLDASGRSIGLADSLIAGIALTYQRGFLTRNVAHFSRVPGLKLLEVQNA